MHVSEDFNASRSCARGLSPAFARRFKEFQQVLLRLRAGRLRAPHPWHPVVPDFGRHSVDHLPYHSAVVDQWRDDQLPALEDQLELVVLDAVAYPARPDVLGDVVHVIELHPGEPLPEGAADALRVERPREAPAHVRAEQRDAAARYQHEEPGEERAFEDVGIPHTQNKRDDGEGYEGRRHAEEERVDEDHARSRAEERPDLHAAPDVLPRPVGGRLVVVFTRVHPLAPPSASNWTDSIMIKTGQLGPFSTHSVEAGAVLTGVSSQRNVKAPE